MEREIYQKLLNWKIAEHRKPLIIYGARQVGKSCILTKFGRNEFAETVILNCEKDPRIKTVFEKGFQTQRILGDSEILSGKKIVPGETLFFIDEIQEVPKALTALKYFTEDAPQIHTAL